MDFWKELKDFTKDTFKIVCMFAIAVIMAFLFIVVPLTLISLLVG